MCIRIPLIVGLVVALIGAGRAEEPLNAPVPLVPAAARAEGSPGMQALSLAAAERAQAMGFPSAAEALWRQLLQDGGVDRGAAVLGLATALLDQGRGLEAEQALETFTGARGAAWHLRKGLAAALQNEITTARNERDASRINELPAGDRSWHLFLQGLIATAENEHGKAVVLFSQAADAAVSPTVRARFLLKQDQVRLRGAAPISEADVERARKTVEQYQGRRVGYEAARTYAAMLDALGRQREAVAVLQRLLVSLPAEERGELDETRLLLGLIAGAEDGAGRNALERLLERGSDRDKQRIALLLLARASTRNPALADFRKLLDQLIGAAEPHPILEDLLLYRAQAALTAAQAAPSSELYARAEDDARTLLQTFPGTPLKAQVYGVLTESAWQQQRYRTAADNAVKARAELAAGPERAALGVLVAEAWFRARDFRAAADAYAAALREPPADVPPGKLIFQRVLAEMETDSPENAAALLDGLARDPAFDLVSRWQAEWNLARALQVRGKTTEAYARVTKLLGEGGPEVATLPAELRVRMGWLQARLSAAAGRPEETLRLVDALLGSLTGVGADLRNEVASSSELLRARANFALGREAAALAVLKKLRDEFPRTDAAVYSYFEEAEHYAKQDKAAEAQQLLTKLADDFPENKTYAPLALLQAALQAERRGQDANLDEALRLIEDLVQKYPDSELVFAARLKQGDLLRRRNQFPQAQQVYEDLMNKFAQRPDVVLAQLALAETHNAQSVNEPAHAESAAMLFEHVRDRMDAPVDARVEAGFSLGLLHRRRAEAEKVDATRRRELARAESVWWRDVVSAFLLDPAQAAQLGDKGRYWMTRTLLELGSLYEQQEKLEQAKQAWLLVLQAKLGYGEALAKARLARFELAEVKP